MTIIFCNFKQSVQYSENHNATLNPNEELASWYNFIAFVETSHTVERFISRISSGSRLMWFIAR